MSLLAEMPGLVLDGQTTGPTPERGRLLELAWARLPGVGADVEARLVALPAGQQLPARIRRLTGITAADLAAALPAERVWAALMSAAAGLGAPPWPLVIHYARFEAPFLRALHAACGAGDFPFRLICTHAIAQRLLPGLPRRGLRAVAGFFGHHLDAPRRAGDHARATALVWRELIARLRARRGVETLVALEAWLRREAPKTTRRKTFRLPRAKRLALPAGPGVYRLLGRDGRVLYAGKAGSLRARVNAHFGSPAAAGEKNLELYSQVWDLAATPCASALEAALLELEQIRDQRPAYNAALLPADERVWFAAADLAGLADRPDRHHRLGPLPDPALMGPLGLLGLPVAVAPPAGWPGPAAGTAALAAFWARHGPAGAPRAAWLLRLGGRLARRAAAAPQPAAAPDEEAERAVRALEAWLIRLARLIRRGLWLTRLSEAELAYATRAGAVRRLSIRAGRIRSAPGGAALDPPPPPAAGRDRMQRQAGMDRRVHDRLRVLSSEMRRLLAAGRPLALRLGPGPALAGPRLARALRRC